MSWSDRPASAARDDGTTSTDVVFDRTNLTPERRAAVAALFPEHRRVVVVCSAWLATLFERVATRAARTGTTAAVVEAQFEGFATPPPSETPLLPFAEVVCPDRALALAGGR